jgi:hypothetical protein
MFVIDSSIRVTPSIDFLLQTVDCFPMIVAFRKVEDLNPFNIQGGKRDVAVNKEHVTHSFLSQKQSSTIKLRFDFAMVSIQSFRAG